MNAKGIMTGYEARLAFSLYNYIGQNGPKMTENGHIFPNNNPNDLKFLHKMYLGVFLSIPKISAKSAKKCTFLAKNGHFWPILAY